MTIRTIEGARATRTNAAFRAAERRGAGACRRILGSPFPLDASMYQLRAILSIFFLRPIALQFLRVFAGIRQDCNLVGSSAGQAVKSKKKPPACPLWLCGNNCPGRQLRSAFMPDNYKSYLIAFLASISSRFLSAPQSRQLSSVTVLITF